jgi:Holliday junction resolvase-like predicted endonuclease
MAMMKVNLSRIIHESFWSLGFPLKLKNNQVKGWYGEWLAVQHLKKKSNFVVIKKNWLSVKDARRELDIVGVEDGTLVFVEVRARSVHSLVTGFQSLTMKKRNALRLACKDFLKFYPQKFENYRLDVIEIDLDNSESNLFHHQNVSLFP